MNSENIKAIIVELNDECCPYCGTRFISKNKALYDGRITYLCNMGDFAEDNTWEKCCRFSECDFNQNNKKNV